MKDGNLTIHKDKNGNFLKIGEKVKDADGNLYEIIYCDALERIMIDEPISCKMFEIDDFEVEKLPLSNHQTDMAEQQLLGFFSAKIMTLHELVNSMGLTKEEWEIIKQEYAITYMSEDDKHSIDLYVGK